jgi:hypothetical protein
VRGSANTLGATSISGVDAALLPGGFLMGGQRLTAWDDHFTHQVPLTHDAVGVSDPNWRERMWISAQDATNKDLLVECGMGHYPNRNIQEAWASVATPERQLNFRATRRLRPDLSSMAVGPFRIEVVEPLKIMRLVLEDNASGVTFDFVVESTLTPHVEDRHFEVTSGRITHDLVRYFQLGRAHGTVTFDGRTRSIDRTTWTAARDHSWGVAPIPLKDGTNEHASASGLMLDLTTLVFPTWGHYHVFIQTSPIANLYLTGAALTPLDGDVRNDRLVAVEHDLRWRSDVPIQVLEDGEMRFCYESGATRLVSLTGHGPRVYLRTAGYNEWNGWVQGDDRGAELIVECDEWDLTDDAAIKPITNNGGGCDHLIEATCEGEVGYGIMEYFVTTGYPRYSGIQSGAPRPE